MNLILEFAILTSVLIGCCVATWLAADNHYSQQYTALRAEEIQAAKDQQKAADDLQARNTMVSKEINDAAVQQISALSARVSDLLVRKPATITLTRNVCAASAGPPSAPNPIGPTAPGDVTTPPSASGAVASLDTGTLADVLDTAIWAVKNVQFQREYEAKTGQISASK